MGGKRRQRYKECGMDKLLCTQHFGLSIWKIETSNSSTIHIIFSLFLSVRVTSLFCLCAIVQKAWFEYILFSSLNHMELLLSILITYAKVSQNNDINDFKQSIHVWIVEFASWKGRMIERVKPTIVMYKIQ